MFSNESSAYSVGSLLITAMLPTPSAASSRMSVTIRSMTAFTYGQWLQMNITTRPFGPRAESGECRSPSVPVSSKGAAFQPIRPGGVVRLTMIVPP